MGKNRSGIGLQRWTVVAGMTLAWMSLSISICDAQGAASAWLAAADPFQKFVHDILDFTKWYITDGQAKRNEAMRQVAPALVKSMHEVAARKRQLASDINDALNETQSSHYVNLHRQTTQLDDAVRELLAHIRDLAPDWIVQRNDLTKDIDQMEMQKSVASQQGLQLSVGGRGRQMDKDDARKFAERLNSLANNLDGLADQIAQAIRTSVHS
jgi:hypothetical protein